MDGFNKWLKLIETEELLFEMANIKPRSTDLKYCITITTKQHSAGPRIKVCADKTCLDKSKVIHYTIDKNPEITDDTLKNKKYFKDKKDLNKIIDMIQKYEKYLKIYWYNISCFKDDSSLIESIKQYFKYDVYDVSNVLLEKECIDKM